MKSLTLSLCLGGIREVPERREDLFYDMCSMNAKEGFNSRTSEEE